MFSTTYRIALAFPMVVVCLGCEASVTKVTDDRPRFSLDSSKPFHIEFGRGSGWHGLDTVKIDEAGKVVMHRQTFTGWETTSFTLKPSELNAILVSLNDNRVFSLKRAYHLEGVVDGTQWVFWATQGEGAKTVYFNNYFPNSIVAFAEDLDSQLGIQNRQLSWIAVPAAKIRDHEKELWDSIKAA